jgi:predicted benzoate:H+ symporter BenE
MFKISIFNNPILFIKKRVISFKSQISFNEVSGSLGDLGTLIPLLIAMSKEKLIYLPGAFFWGGVFNIISAFQWDIPMPVQPMKAIASVALTDGLTFNEVITSGLITSAIVTIFGITKTIDYFNKIIPLDLISGMQLGLGLNMMKKGIVSIRDTNTWVDIDSYLTAIIIAIFSLILFKFKKMPVALILFIVGIVFSSIIAVKQNILIEVIPIFPPIWVAGNLTGPDFLNGFIKGALPQIPLTTLNSVISVCALSKELFPNNYPSRVSVATSIGLMNGIGCLFGGMPMCHGAGGLSGQYKFGARGGFSILILGSGKILLSIIFGQSLINLLAVFPDVILGILIMFSGLQLAMVGIEKCSTNITVATAGIILGTNTWIGFACGYTMIIIQKSDYSFCKTITDKCHIQKNQNNQNITIDIPN